MKNIDCLTMVSTLKQECNTLNYKLKRIVADKDSQSVLQPKKTEKVDVIPSTYMSYKIPTRDMQAPGQIHFAYAEGQFVRSRRATMRRLATQEAPPSPTSPGKKQKVSRQKVELVVYFSLSEKNREPTAENCDKAVDSPSGCITMPMVGKDRFENDDVYLSLFSISGCTVYLTVSFPELKI